MDDPISTTLRLPITEFDSVVEDLRERLHETHYSALLVNWGHVIDSSLHINILMPGKFDKGESPASRLEPYLIDVVVSHGGSISAEHGSGQEKNVYLNKVKDPHAIDELDLTPHFSGVL